MTLREGYGKTIVTPQNGAPGSDTLGYFSIFDGGNNAGKGKSQQGQTTQTAPNY